MKVAPIGDTENGDRGDGEALGCQAGAQAGGPALPKHRAGEEGRLGRPPKADPDELGEEYAQTFVKLGR